MAIFIPQSRGFRTDALVREISWQKLAKAMVKITRHRHPGSGWTVPPSPRRREKPSETADTDGEIKGKNEVR